MWLVKAPALLAVVGLAMAIAGPAGSFTTGAVCFALGVVPLIGLGVSAYRAWLHVPHIG